MPSTKGSILQRNPVALTSLQLGLRTPNEVSVPSLFPSNVHATLSSRQEGDSASSSKTVSGAAEYSAFALVVERATAVRMRVVPRERPPDG